MIMQATIFDNLDTTPIGLSTSPEVKLPSHIEDVLTKDGRSVLGNEKSFVNDDSQAYLNSFVKCSPSRFFIEYQPSINVPPKNEIDLNTWQLEEIFLPQFKPSIEPPAWLRLTIPADGYSCHSCGDIFYMETSRIQHKERRSVWIALQCGPCNAKLIFYNRCAFKDHVKEHVLKGEKVNVDSVLVRALPLQLSKLLQPIMVPVPNALRINKKNEKAGKPVNDLTSFNDVIGKDKVNSYEIDKRSTINGCGGLFTNDCSQQTHCLLTNETSSLKPHVQCYLCEKVFYNVRELMSHMRTNQPFSDQRVECKKCLLVLPSVCAAKAHILTHPPANAGNISVCPECGSKCGGPRDFVHHLNTCGHQFRRSGILCTQCLVCFFKFPEDFITHWVKEHCIISYKCVICSNSFESLEFHKCCILEDQVLTTFKCLFKCPLCSCIDQIHVKDEREITDKVKLHLSESHSHIIRRVHYVFKSKFCSNAFRSKDELRAHHDREHKRENHYRTKFCTLHHEVLKYQFKFFNGQEPRSAFITLPVTLSAEELLEAKTRDVPSVSSVIDKTLFLDIDNLKSIRTEKFQGSVEDLKQEELYDESLKYKNELEGIYPCICYMCGINCDGKKKFLDHIMRCDGESAERLCQACGVTSLKEAFSDHCLSHIQDGQIICIYCNGTQFSSQHMLQKHFQCHIKEQFIYPFICPFCLFEISDVPSAISHIKYKHDPVQLRKRFDFDSHLTDCNPKCELTTFTSMSATGWHCQLCKKALSSAIFAKHMVSHFEEGLYICTICDGLVFPIKDVLMQHLDAHSNSLPNPYRCLLCSIEIDEPTNVLMHIMGDHGFGNFCCSICKMKYSYNYQLQKHYNIVHKNSIHSKKRYICWLCQAYDSVSKDTLMNHIKIVHDLTQGKVNESLMIRTRCRDTMPSSFFIPMKLLGFEENGFASPSEDDNQNNNNEIAAIACGNSPPKKSIPSTVIKKKKKLPITSKKFYFAKIKQKQNLRTSSMCTIHSEPEKWIDQEFNATNSKSISLDPVLDKNLLHNYSSNNHDKKLQDKTKVLLKRLSESVIVRHENFKKEAFLPKYAMCHNSPSPRRVKTKRLKAYKCYICYYVTNNQDKLDRHMTKHCSNIENFLCNICGESFVVEISLQRHMFFAHKIKKFISSTYKKVDKSQLILKRNEKKLAFKKLKISRRKSNTKKLKISIRSKKKKVIPMNPVMEPICEKNIINSPELQCCVCYKDFNKSIELYSHLRTHGMAFIKIGQKSRPNVNEISPVLPATECS